MKRFSLTMALLLLPALAGAQDVGSSTEQRINRAIGLYDALRVEEARPILLNIISPGYLQQVSEAQRVQAYTYLGLSYALDSRDSAVTYFVAALDYDPFTDLDPTKFIGAELGAFAEAKQRIFKVKPAPIRSRVVVPRSDTAAFRFRLITTHRAQVTVTMINQANTTQSEELHNGQIDGIRPIDWRGTWRGDSLPPPGVYELQVVGRSGIEANAQPVTERLLFRIEHAHEPLERPIPPLTLEGGQLLREQYPSSGPWFDLGLGGVIAVGAFAMPALILDGDDIGAWQTHAGAAIGVGLVSAGISFLYRRSTDRRIAANVAENQRRQAARDEFNAQVEARNRARIAQTLLVITPVAR